MIPNRQLPQWSQSAETLEPWPKALQIDMRHVPPSQQRCGYYIHCMLLCLISIELGDGRPGSSKEQEKEKKGCGDSHSNPLRIDSPRGLLTYLGTDIIYVLKRQLVCFYIHLHRHCFLSNIYIPTQERMGRRSGRHRSQMRDDPPRDRP